VAGVYQNEAAAMLDRTSSVWVRLACWRYRLRGCRRHETLECGSSASRRPA